MRHCGMTGFFGGVACKMSSIVIRVGKHMWNEHKILVVTTVTLASAVKIHQIIKKRRLRENWDSAGENVVVVHGPNRATTSPSLSPFVVKLETYLRMAEIKYVFDTEQPMGPKGKTPWITLNGEDYADSQLIMELLGKKFNKNFSSGLTKEQKAVARAMLIMTDEHILWGLAWWRFCSDPDSRILSLMKLPWMIYYMFPLIKRRIKHLLWTQGLGRHSDQEIEEMIRKDIEALSLYLGEKPFLMGDNPCEVDCAVFGMVAQFTWGAPGSVFASMVQSEYRNLLHYSIRMKEKFWPDWENHLQK